MNKLFTSESVTLGHPDKLCDLISDMILDEYLKKDSNSRVAIETVAYSKGIMVMGEVSSTSFVNIEKIVRDTVKDIGYNDLKLGFNGDNITVKVCINKQSPDIALGILKEDKAVGAGDQGIMYGYASNETDNYMPYPIYVAKKLSKKLYQVYKDKTISYLRPDGKTQVTVRYENNIPKYIDTIILSIQHDDIDIEILRKDIKKYVIDEVIDKKMVDENTKIYINPTGRFVIGGPVSDTGLTGRKIMVDTYGGLAHHGGGAFSGKDATKVDRSASYYARYVCKNIVASGLCDKIELSVAYAIGVSKPVSLSIDTFNTNKISEENILDIINKVFDFSPKNIILELGLDKPIYHLTKYAHFGIDNVSWEKLDKVDKIKEFFSLNFCK